MIQKFVDLVNETVDESFARGVELFLENLNDEMLVTHKIVNEGLDAVLEQACSMPEGEETESKVETVTEDDEIDSLTDEEIMEAMEALDLDEVEETEENKQEQQE